MKILILIITFMGLWAGCLVADSPIYSVNGESEIANMLKDINVYELQSFDNIDVYRYGSSNDAVLIHDYEEYKSVIYTLRNVDFMSTGQALKRSIYNEAILSGRFSGSDC